MSAAARERLAVLARRLRALQDPVLHPAVVAQHVTGAAPEAVVLELDAVLRRANAPTHALTWAALCDWLLSAEAPSHELREALYRAAREASADGVALLLLDPPPLRDAGSWLGEADPDLLDRTLGERKGLARRPDRGLLQRLLRVTEPAVIRILLGNPRLTETDVLWLAARRPNVTNVLEEVARARRWRTLPRVRLALAQNPYARPHVAVLQCPLLSLPELRAVAEDTALHPLVLEMARYLVAVRAPATDDAAEATVIPFRAASDGPSPAARAPADEE